LLLAVTTTVVLQLYLLTRTIKFGHNRGGDSIYMASAPCLWKKWGKLLQA